MRNLLLSFILFICMCLPARAAEYKFDTWEASWQVLNIIEWSLTDKIIKQGGEEVGLARLAFGSKPETKELAIGCAAVGVIHLGLNWYFHKYQPHLLRTFRLVGTTAKVGVVGYEFTVVEW